MPSTVASIFEAAGIKRDGVAQWGTPVECRAPGQPGTGIYVVAVTPKLNRVEETLAEAPVVSRAVDVLLRRRPELAVDGQKATRQRLIHRLGEFWLPDEAILYIGLAGKRDGQDGDELPNRVSEYGRTRLGAKSPHAGGWPLLTLSCLADLHVHYAYCDDVDAAERAALSQFAARVSPTSRAALRDQVRVMPFANLEYPRRSRKDHGIKGARGPVASGEPVPW